MQVQESKSHHVQEHYKKDKTSNVCSKVLLGEYGSKQRFITTDILPKAAATIALIALSYFTLVFIGRQIIDDDIFGKPNDNLPTAVLEPIAGFLAVDLTLLIGALAFGTFHGLKHYYTNDYKKYKNNPKIVEEQGKKREARMEEQPDDIQSNVSCSEKILGEPGSKKHYAITRAVPLTTAVVATPVISLKYLIPTFTHFVLSLIQSEEHHSRLQPSDDAPIRAVISDEMTLHKSVDTIIGVCTLVGTAMAIFALFHGIKGCSNLMSDRLAEWRERQKELANEEPRFFKVE